VSAFAERREIKVEYLLPAIAAAAIALMFIQLMGDSWKDASSCYTMRLRALGVTPFQKFKLLEQLDFPEIRALQRPFHEGVHIRADREYFWNESLRATLRYPDFSIPIWRPHIKSNYCEQLVTLWKCARHAAPWPSISSITR
jgi:hypothetical protein